MTCISCFQEIVNPASISEIYAKLNNNTSKKKFYILYKSSISYQSSHKVRRINYIESLITMLQFYAYHNSVRFTANKKKRFSENREYKMVKVKKKTMLR